MKTLLAFALLVLFTAATAKSRAGEKENLATFIENQVKTFDAVQAGLDPKEYAFPRDVFIYSPQFAFGGHIWNVSFEGFSELTDLEVQVTDLRFPPNPIGGSFFLIYRVPVVMTGEYKFNGTWRENETDIPLNGEGSWSLTGTARQREFNAFLEVEPGYATLFPALRSFQLEEEPIWNSSHGFGDNVPQHVVDSIFQNLTVEIWSAHQKDFSADFFLPLLIHINEKFETTPFIDIVTGDQPDPISKVHTSTDPETWPPMDRFLATAMNNFSGTPSEGLEPIYIEDANVRVGIPSYVELEGRISLSLTGVKNFQHDGSYSPEGGSYLYLFTDYNNITLTGRHNFSGTFELDSGEVLNIGGVERDFAFKSHPATSRLVYRYYMNKITGKVTLGNSVVGEAGFLFKNGGFQEWELNLNGLLDEVPEGDQKEEALDWIGTLIQMTIGDEIISKIEYRLTKVLASAFQETTYDEIANGKALN